MKQISNIGAIILSFIIHVFCCAIPTVAIIASSTPLISITNNPLFEFIHHYHLQLLTLATFAVAFAVYQQIKKHKSKPKTAFWRVNGIKLTCISVGLLIFDFVWLFLEHLWLPTSHF